MYGLVAYLPALLSDLLHRLPADFIIIQEATDLSVTSKDTIALGRLVTELSTTQSGTACPFFKARYER